MLVLALWVGSVAARSAEGIFERDRLQVNRDVYVPGASTSGGTTH